MIFKCKPDALGAFQAAAQPITIFLNNAAQSVFVVIKNVGASSTVSKTGIYLDIKLALNELVQLEITFDQPVTGTYYELTPGDVLRLDKLTGASLGSLEADIDINDAVWAKQITIMAQEHINDLKTYWTLASIATALGIASVVGAVTHANVDVAGFTADGQQALEDIISAIPTGGQKPTNPVV